MRETGGTMMFMKIMRMTAVTETMTKTEANGQGHREYCKDTETRPSILCVTQ